MRKWSEPEILEGININNQEAVKQLFDMYWAPLKFLSIELLGKDLSYRDIPESVFIKLLKKNHRFESFEDLQGFLYRSVKNLCLKLVRQDPTSFNMFAEKKIKKDADKLFVKTEVLKMMFLRQQEKI